MLIDLSSIASHNAIFGILSQKRVLILIIFTFGPFLAKRESISFTHSEKMNYNTLIFHILFYLYCESIRKRCETIVMLSTSCDISIIGRINRAAAL